MSISNTDGSSFDIPCAKPVPNTLGEQLHILNLDLILFLFILETKRLLLPKQILPDRLLFPAESCQRKSGCKNNLCGTLSPSFLHLLCDRYHCQQIIIFIGGFIFYQCLASGTANIITVLILQNILQNILHSIRFILIACDSCWETHLPCLDS